MFESFCERILIRRENNIESDYLYQQSIFGNRGILPHKAILRTLFLYYWLLMLNFVSSN